MWRATTLRAKDIDADARTIKTSALYPWQCYWLRSRRGAQWHWRNRRFVYGLRDLRPALLPAAGFFRVGRHREPLGGRLGLLCDDHKASAPAIHAARLRSVWS
jgi:hypothetical protein